MKKIIEIVIVLIVGIFLFMYFKPVKITNYPSKGDSIVMFGDSLIYGVGSTSGNDMATLISNEIGEPVINMGVPGETSAQGLLRINDVIEKNPKVVFILFGGNDFLHKIPLANTFKNIDNMVVEIQKSGAVVILLGIQGGVLTDPYDTEFEKIVKKRGTLHVTNVLGGLIGNREFMSDAVHPNDAGYRKIVDRILPVLRKGR
ncbi:arylesterase [Candidatus Gracilibacteria bacterium]|nr:arylesterase [Candidatus Gracilibacteria bacterium]MCF7898348.1 arylesterase [Candidatus Paceibacterota bacterium]